MKTKRKNKGDLNKDGKMSSYERKDQWLSPKP